MFRHSDHFYRSDQRRHSDYSGGRNFGSQGNYRGGNHHHQRYSDGGGGGFRHHGNSFRLDAASSSYLSRKYY